MQLDLEISMKNQSNVIEKRHKIVQASITLIVVADCP